MSGNSHRILFHFLFLILLLKSIVAHPQVARRQESIWDPFWDMVWKGITTGTDDLGGMFRGFVLPPIPGTTPDPQTESDELIPSIPILQPLDQGTRTPQNPKIPLPLDSPQMSTQKDRCNKFHPVGAPDDQLQCEISTRKIVYPVDRRNSVQNSKIEGLLVKEAHFGQVYTSVLEGEGIVFWTGELTEEAAATVHGTPGVLAVVPDIRMVKSETSPVDASPIPKRSQSLAQKEKARLEQRDEVLTQTSDFVDLAFISTPPGSKPYRPGRSYSYHYFSAAGEGVTVYLFDSGANFRNDEFSSGVIEEYIYTFYSQKTQSDEILYNGHGTCLASKIAGAKYGVAKKAKLIIVKNSLRGFLSSFIDGLAKILNSLFNRQEAGREIRGYTVVNCPIGFPMGRLDPTSKMVIEDFITKMLTTYQVVYVTSAGDVKDASVRYIDTIPAILSPKLPIIVVSGVYPYAGSTPHSGLQKYGPEITVNAPREVKCAGRRGGDDSHSVGGADYASAIVAGLVAYFLSLHDLGPILRRNMLQIPQAVKQYIIDGAYVRPSGTERAIWNRLNAGSPDYGWVP